MAGVPIPIKIKGPWENIAYNIDWKTVFENVATDPERLKHLPQDLRDVSKNFGVALPLLRLPDTGKGASPLGPIEQLNKLIQKEPTAPAPATEAPKEAPKKGAKQAKEKPAPADPLKTIQDLFKR